MDLNSHTVFSNGAALKCFVRPISWPVNTWSHFESDVCIIILSQIIWPSYFIIPIQSILSIYEVFLRQKIFWGFFDTRLDMVKKLAVRNTLVKTISVQLCVKSFLYLLSFLTPLHIQLFIKNIFSPNCMSFPCFISQFLTKTENGPSLAVRNIQCHYPNRSSPWDLLLSHKYVRLMLFINDGIKFVDTTDLGLWAEEVFRTAILQAVRNITLFSKISVIDIGSEKSFMSRCIWTQIRKKWSLICLLVLLVRLPDF